MTRPRLTHLANVIAVIAVMTACSTDDPTAGPAADGGPTTAAPADPAAGTVVIEHRYGSTEVEERPRRIVSLDLQWTDVLASLGAPPVGYLLDPNADGGSFPWRDDLLADATGMTATDALPYEQIAALRPDLIVVGYFAQDQADYETLSAIAPTIATLSDSQVDTWQDIAVAAGKVLDVEDRAGDLVSDVDGQVAAVASDLPTLAGTTFSLVNYVAGDAFYVVSDPDDGASVLFDQLGMTISPTILDAGKGEESRVTLSLEQSALLDADVLLLLTNGAEPESIPGYDDLPAVGNGAVMLLDYVDATAVNTPTPLSVPFFLEQLRPVLEAAAGT